MMTKNSPKLANKFYCDTCDYKCSKKSDYAKHCLTKKHKNTTNSDILQQENRKTFICACGKSYTHRASLFNHKKLCIIEQTKDKNVIIPSNADNNKDIIELLIKENSDIKNIMLDVVRSNSDLQKQLLDVCKNANSYNTINSHNNNKTFNLQLFLNEQCKDAMNISDFVNSFDLQLSDLESVGDLGYVEGMTKIFLDKLSSTDIYKRPMHCSDAKRETIYIKDEDRWEKEQRSNPKLRNAIKTLSFTPLDI